MFIKGSFAEKNAILNAAEKMCAAARTAPKTRGVDHIMTAILTEDDKDALAGKMLEIGEKYDLPGFLRDKKNVDASACVVLIGTSRGSRGLSYCGYCGCENCFDMAKSGGNCSYDDIDLGIALGSAATVAADERIDNRIMFSVGKAAYDLKLLGDGIEVIIGIPLSVSGKSKYFDRG